ncbi:MAG: hypothetical protein PHG91_05595 [Syntrophales bacterium]|nr:hypothetical protein [Syntrophales bacterium]MDD5232847.1 hypothetical protein [Syntrophales bacterium]MDD5532586.1 hypothetical protein [Syntrophales bacterium]
MIIGIPREIKDQEYRVAMTPGGVQALVAAGHRVLVQAGMLAEAATEADLLIGAVLVKGARAPRVITRTMISAMQAGSVAVDVSVDQGGCMETTRPTTHSDPVYSVDGFRNPLFPLRSPYKPAACRQSPLCILRSRNNIPSPGTCS